MSRPQLVGSVLVHDEEAFVEQAIRNVAGSCDRIHVIDHLSTDRTPEILTELAGEYDHLEVVRTHDAAESHRRLERYAGTDTWVLAVDGDELFDPAGIAQLRERLDEDHADVFRLKGHVLNCDVLDHAAGSATGWMSPPSRPMTKLFNMSAVDSWRGCLERLHGGDTVFRPGYDWDAMRYLSDGRTWDEDPLRMLHVCFLPRSSKDGSDAARRSLPETRAYRRGLRGWLHRRLQQRHLDPRIREYATSGTTWKQEWYALGERVTIDARPFFQPTA